jgi:16S rRNA (guanine966-N2)-methyltransferase
MRVIAGQYGGRKLKTPPAKTDFRPTTDRVRESLFNILEHAIGFKGKQIADVFAGTGSLGIEALSRGAQHAVFVEKNPRHAALIKENLVALGLQDRGEILTTHVEKYLQTVSGVFDIVFCDPPYGYDETARLLDTIAAKKLLIQNGLLCFEHSGKQVPAVNMPWNIRETRAYGTTAITLMTLDE